MKCPVYYGASEASKTSVRRTDQLFVFLFDKDKVTFLIYQIFFNYFLFVVCKGFEPIFIQKDEVSCLSLSQDKLPLDEHTAEIILQ